MVEKCAWCGERLKAAYGHVNLYLSVWSLQSKSSIEFVFCGDLHLAEFLNGRSVTYNPDNRHVACEVNEVG